MSSIDLSAVVLLVGVALASGLCGLAVALAVVRRPGVGAAPAEAATVQAAVDAAVSVATARLGDVVADRARVDDARDRTVHQRVEHVTRSLDQLGSMVAELRRERAEQAGSLGERLDEVARTQQRLAEHTDSLRAALAHPAKRGQWGERMTDDVLRAAGFVEGVNYRRQAAVSGGGVPDFTFLLPNDVELRMDVKFPADNYLRVLDATDDDARAAATKAFVRDVRARVRELAGRGYVDARDTVDCMLLFIPNEATYQFLHESDPEIVDIALAEQVVLCSPGTLFAVLAVVRRSVEQFRLERTSDEILRCLGGLTDEWQRFCAALDKVSRSVDGLNRAFGDELNGTRRRQFERALGQIDALAEPPPAASVAAGSSAGGGGDGLAARKAEGDVRPLPAPNFRGEEGAAS